MNSLDVFVNYWKELYLNENPWNELEQYYQKIPEKARKNFSRDFLPQPYYGYFHEEMKDDILLLLINPGRIDINEVKEWFPNETEKNRILKWNKEVCDRYVSWNKADYIDKEKVSNNRGIEWRKVRKKQAHRIFGNFDFLHTIEFFPFHSHAWKLSGQKNQEWIYELEPTRFVIEALQYIAQKKKVKHIVGIGKPWVDILNHYNDKFIQVGDCCEIRGNKRFRHKFYKFSAGNDSIPIIIYISGGGGINLPKHPDAQEIIRELSLTET